MVAKEESWQALQSLGFTELEAAIYTFLLQETLATGYKIAKAIGKPVANTYKGISSLQGKGAIIVEEGESRLCRAIPPKEVFGQMQQSLQQRCEQAVEALANLHPPPEDARVYRLQSREQVLERVKQMLGRCRQVAIVIVFPQVLELIQADLEAAAKRGVAVLLKVYRPVEVAGAQIVVSNEAEQFLSQYPGQELHLVTDAEEHLIALLDKAGKGVIQAIWSASAFLSVIHYDGFYHEWEMTRVTRWIAEGIPLESFQKTLLNRAYPMMETPGFQQLVHHQSQPLRDATG